MKRLVNQVLMFGIILFAFVGAASAAPPVNAGPPTIINPGGWKDDGEWVRLSEPSDNVSIGENSASSTEYKLNVKDGAFNLLPMIAVLPVEEVCFSYGILMLEKVS